MKKCYPKKCPNFNSLKIVMSQEYLQDPEGELEEVKTPRQKEQEELQRKQYELQQKEKEELNKLAALGKTPPSSSFPPPTSTYCSVCGKVFGSKSIEIHEKQCLKKWHLQNDNLPVGEREPMVGQKLIPKKSLDHDKSFNLSSPDTTQTTPQPQQSPLFPCYLCGRLFTVHTIYTHEEECLKSWREENEKLPKNKRKKEPLKPDIKFTPSGGVDFRGTFNRVWENHLNELEECPKCGRKFFPDRIEKHINSCAGTRVDIKYKSKGVVKSGDNVKRYSKK